MSLLKLSCKKATEMVEQDKIVSLSLVDRLKLKLHISVCKACKVYQKQSDLLDTFFSKSKDLDDIPTEENPQLKNKILKQLDENH
ncbi:MAG: hypothetical protein COW67_00920 [Flavobacteriales bacterium CG18_big_fil_WC_8_21_14_2_50_32_9]|nr:hypothetical protein [Flavobacteriales bacterium]PIQ16832.1 MAG: hypothetical protein COW67_00920 [Flavobacteriales bacterium CG18_big_fil_WC_8_21_14_2_50_32_9]